MSIVRVCDFCGRHDFPNPFENRPREWVHYYDTGKDECHECVEKRDRERIRKVLDGALAKAMGKLLVHANVDPDASPEVKAAVVAMVESVASHPFIEQEPKP